MFLRVDMPGHIKHKDGDSFSEVYLSYHGRIPASEFRKDFAPDEKFLYVRQARCHPAPDDPRLSHPRPEDRQGRALAGGNDARPRRSSPRPGAISAATSA